MSARLAPAIDSGCVANRGNMSWKVSSTTGSGIKSRTVGLLERHRSFEGSTSSGNEEIYCEDMVVDAGGSSEEGDTEMFEV